MYASVQMHVCMHVSVCVFMCACTGIHVCVLPGTEPGASLLLSKHSTTELYPLQLSVISLFINFTVSFEAGSCNVTQAGLVLAVSLRQAFDLPSSCLSLLGD